MDLLSTIGQELRSHKVAFAEHWGETLNALQLGRLRNQLREADVSLDDISVAEEQYKDKLMEGACYGPFLSGCLIKRSAKTKEIMEAWYGNVIV